MRSSNPRIRAIITLSLIMMLSSCAKCPESGPVSFNYKLKKKEVQHKRKLGPNLAITFIKQDSINTAMPFKRFQTAQCQGNEWEERDIYAETATCTREKTKFEEEPVTCAVMLAVGIVLTVVTFGYMALLVGADDCAKAGTKTVELTTETGKKIYGPWKTMQDVCDKHWTAKSVSIVIHDLDEKRDIWSWQGITNERGEVEIPDSRHFHLSLLSIYRGRAIRGEFRLSSDGRQDVISLDQYQAIKDWLAVVGPR